MAVFRIFKNLISRWTMEPIEFQKLTDILLERVVNTFAFKGKILTVSETSIGDHLKRLKNNKTRQNQKIKVQKLQFWRKKLVAWLKICHESVQPINSK